MAEATHVGTIIVSSLVQAGKECDVDVAASQVRVLVATLIRHAERIENPRVDELKGMDCSSHAQVSRQPQCAVHDLFQLLPIQRCHAWLDQILHRLVDPVYDAVAGLRCSIVEGLLVFGVYDLVGVRAPFVEMLWVVMRKI